ncbi:hypothetical protein D3C81_1800150 [compost metagenome]
MYCDQVGTDRHPGLVPVRTRIVRVKNMATLADGDQPLTGSGQPRERAVHGLFSLNRRPVEGIDELRRYHASGKGPYERRAECQEHYPPKHSHRFFPDKKTTGRLTALPMAKSHHEVRLADSRAGQRFRCPLGLGKRFDVLDTAVRA